jgi:hypothetical protein
MCVWAKIAKRGEPAIPGIQSRVPLRREDTGPRPKEIYSKASAATFNRLTVADSYLRRRRGNSRRGRSSQERCDEELNRRSRRKR